MVIQSGCDPDIFEPVTRYERSPNGIVYRPDGTANEMLYYPTNTPGLVFERSREFQGETGKTHSFSWSVIDKAPEYRFDFRDWWQNIRSTTVFQAGNAPSSPR